jgi:hypothetical protein
MFRKYCSALLVFGLAGLLAPSSTAQNQTTPDLTGTWVLNAGLSDRPGQGSGGQDGSGEGGRRGGPGGGGMGGPGGGGMGGFGARRGGGGQDGGMPDQEEMERRRASLDAVMRTPARLIIVKGDPGLIVTDEEGVSTRLALNGKDTGAVNGVPFETTTKWENGKLRVEKKFKGGLKVLELYSVSAEPRLLTISSKIEGGRGGSRTVNRVYDRHAPEAR